METKSYREIDMTPRRETTWDEDERAGRIDDVVNFEELTAGPYRDGVFRANKANKARKKNQPFVSGAKNAGPAT